MKRRKFITLLGGAAAAWPLAASAQRAGRVRRVGVLVNLSADSPETQARVGAFLQGLQELGWAIGRNVRIDSRFPSNAGSIAGSAAELLALAPEVVLANANPSVEALLQLSRTLPIVFVAVTEPVGSGLVESMARPGGNATGFASAEFGTSAKWLELLKDLSPHMTRAAMLQDLTTGGAAQFAAIQSVAGSFGVALSSLAVRDAGEIEPAVTAFARVANGRLIVARNALLITHRDLIIELAARHRLPAIYPLRSFVAGGGLISYGPDIVDQYRRAAAYVDRILKGEKPADLPVQAPTKYEEIPQTLLTTADWRVRIKIILSQCDFGATTKQFSGS